MTHPLSCALLLLLTLLFLYSLHVFLWRSHRKNSEDVLLSVRSTIEFVEKIESTKVFACPDAARDYVRTLHVTFPLIKCCLYREQERWIVIAGYQLQIEAKDDGKLLLHFFQKSAPFLKGKK